MANQHKQINRPTTEYCMQSSLHSYIIIIFFGGGGGGGGGGGEMHKNNQANNL